MQVHQLKVKIQKKKRRVGRGGRKGTYCGRGMKGQKSRSGVQINPIFEGGRSTLIERLPKLRGFKSPYLKNQVVNLEKIEKYFKDGEIVSPYSLHERGLISKISVPVKVLGGGKIRKKLIIKKCLTSVSAREKIKTVGGKVL